MGAGGAPRTPGQPGHDLRLRGDWERWLDFFAEGVQASATQALTLLGAVPVSKPVSETYELLSSGVLDGTFMPPESIPAFKLTDLVPHATIVPGAIVIWFVRHYIAKGFAMGRV